MNEPKSKVAKVSADVIAQLQDLHPSEPEPHCTGKGKSLEINEEILFCSMIQTKRDAAAGPSGLDGNLIQILKHNQDLFSLLQYLAKKILTGEFSSKNLFLSAEPRRPLWTRACIFLSSDLQN